MTRVWHIGPRRYANTAFTGKGGLYVDGRWHHAGQLVIYTASSEALAALEILAHVRSIDNIASLVVRYADFGDIAQKEVSISDLPEGWDLPEPSEATRKLGDNWLRSGRSAVLWVPSVHVQSARNALLNPIHPEFKKITISKASAFRFDRRIEHIVREASKKSRTG